MLSKQTAKYIQSLAQKKFRDQEGVFMVEGPKIVKELISNPSLHIRELFAVREWIDHEEGQRAVTEVTDQELERISQLSTPNQVLALVEKLPVRPIETKNKIVLLLDGIQDPGNLGTLVRIADWFGVTQLVCSPESADLYNPKVIQATMGSFARVSVLYTEIEDWLNQHATVRIYASALEGRAVETHDKIREGVIIIGNESKGIAQALLERAHEKITITRKGEAESLNAAVAAGIILSHLT